MPWPSRITRAFATVEGADDIIIVDRYSGPHNALFHTLLPPEADFMLSPNYIWDDDNYGGTDVILSFKISFRQHPVLTLQVNPPQHLSLDLKREAADRQIRLCLVDLTKSTSLPVLYGIIAMGTKLCFYESKKEQNIITPKHIPRDPGFMIDAVPREWWDCDILEANGEQKLRELATKITEACEHLQA